MKIAILFLVFYILGSCISITAPEFRKFNGVQGINQGDEGFEAMIELLVFNPNKIPLKLINGSTEVFVEDKKLGNVFFKEKITLKKNKETLFQTKVYIQPQEGFLKILLPLILKKTTEIKFKGKIKGRALLITKTSKFEFSNFVNPKELLQGINKYRNN